MIFTHHIRERVRAELETNSAIQTLPWQRRNRFNMGIKYIDVRISMLSISETGTIKRFLISNKEQCPSKDFASLSVLLGLRVPLSPSFLLGLDAARNRCVGKWNFPVF